MAVRRTPRQTIYTMIMVVCGVWLGIGLMQTWREGRTKEFVKQLPDYELVDVSAEELYERAGITPREGDPTSWRHIHMRHYAEDQNGYLKVLRCQLSPEEVEQVNRHIFTAQTRRRTRDDLPPEWWPGQADAEGPWALPDWWQPSGSQSLTFMEQRPDASWLAEYINYDPATEWFHLWEFHRYGIDAPASPLEALVADHVVKVVLAQLQAGQHALSDDGWYRVPEYSVDRLGIAHEHLPAGMSQLSVAIQPAVARVPSYLLAVHGIKREAVSAFMGELEMRSMPADGAAPTAAWDFTLGQDQALPSWFDPGAGPRWGHVLVRPGRGTVDAGRWAAYDEARAILFVWNWHSTMPYPASADILSSDQLPAQ